MLFKNVARTVALVLLTACGSHKMETPSMEKIVGGQVSSPSSVGFKSTVGLVLSSERGTSICTGTLVSSELVITAAHCIKKSIARVVYFGSNLRNYRDDTENVREITEQLAHPGFAYIDQDPNHDIGWVKFSGGVPEGFAPVKVYKGNVQSLVKKDVVLAGFGKTDDETKLGPSGYHNHVNTIINSYINNDKYKSLLIMGPTFGKGACKGDSGGPAYVTLKNELYVVGATHGVNDELMPEIPNDENDPDYGKMCVYGHSIYVAVTDYLGWFEETAGVKL